jgi:hypothetical protein
MDYVAEAKKFIQRATDADNADVVRQHLKIADWLLEQEIEEREEVAFSEKAAGENCVRVVMRR